MRELTSLPGNCDGPFLQLYVLEVKAEFENVARCAPVRSLARFWSCHEAAAPKK